MSGQVTIYGLCDEYGSVWYVGQTRQVEKRRGQHRKRWPHLTLIALAVVPEERADVVERQWIEHYRTQGQELFNAASYHPYGRHAPVEKRHHVLMQLSAEVLADLRAVAAQRSLPVATCARQLIGERLDALEAQEVDYEPWPIR